MNNDQRRAEAARKRKYMEKKLSLVRILRIISGDVEKWIRVKGFSFSLHMLPVVYATWSPPPSPRLRWPRSVKLLSTWLSITIEVRKQFSKTSTSPHLHALMFQLVASGRIMNFRLLPKRLLVLVLHMTGWRSVPPVTPDENKEVYERRH